MTNSFFFLFGVYRVLEKSSSFVYFSLISACLLGSENTICIDIFLLPVSCQGNKINETTSILMGCLGNAHENVSRLDQAQFFLMKNINDNLY